MQQLNHKTIREETLDPIYRSTLALSVSFEGISNILESEPSEKTIKNIFYIVCKKNKVSLSRKKINEIVDEIFQNAKLVQRKLNQGENHGKL